MYWHIACAISNINRKKFQMLSVYFYNTKVCFDFILPFFPCDIFNTCKVLFHNVTFVIVILWNKHYQKWQYETKTVYRIFYAGYDINNHINKACIYLFNIERIVLHNCLLTRSRSYLNETLQCNVWIAYKL